MNTNGHANAVYKMDVAEEFKVPRFETSSAKKNPVSESEAIEIVKQYYALFEGEKDGIINLERTNITHINITPKSLGYIKDFLILL